MIAGITVFCFAASYGVALALELVRPWVGGRWRARLATIMLAAGLLAHTLYLGHRGRAG